MSPGKSLHRETRRRSAVAHAHLRAGLEPVRSIGQALLDRGLSAERPVAILSDNDLEHFLLTFAGQHVGIPTAPLSPAYSLVSKDFGKLRHTLEYSDAGAGVRFARRRYAPRDRSGGRRTRGGRRHDRASGPPQRDAPFADLLETNPTPAVDAAHENIDPDGVAKFLFTSGSTAMPKAVINTHRMICSNQQMIAQIFGFLEDDPPVIVDWLPWNHTFGGNHDVGIALYNGGTFYIDDGKPGPGSIEKTVRNLREISTTVYFNVPKGYEDLLPFLRADRELRENFLPPPRLDVLRGAGFRSPSGTRTANLPLETCGERIIMATGLGSTETSPMAIQTTWETDRAGTIGMPVPGVELKLVPRGTKLEAACAGPTSRPGTGASRTDAKSFRRGGLLLVRRRGAVRSIRTTSTRGCSSTGGLTEDFKLANGTWVNVGPLRAQISGPLRAVRSRRGDRRARPRLHRRADISGSRCVPLALPGGVAGATPEPSCDMRRCARNFNRGSNPLPRNRRAARIASCGRYCAKSRRRSTPARSRTRAR